MCVMLAISVAAYECSLNSTISNKNISKHYYGNFYYLWALYKYLRLDYHDHGILPSVLTKVEVRTAFRSVRCNTFTKLVNDAESQPI